MQLVEEFLGVLEKQHALIEQLSENKTGRSLVDKNLIKSQNSTFNSEVNNSKLNSNEKSRVKDASSIFISKFFEEQKRRTKDKAEKTLVSKISKPLKQSTTLTGSGESDSGGWLNKLLGLLGLGFLKWPALKQLLKKGLSKLFEKTKTILSKVWGLIKNAFGKVWSGIKGLFSKLWTGIKSLGSKIWNSKFAKGIRGIISSAWKSIKGVFNSVKNKIVGMFRSIGRSISGLWGKITNSKPYKAFTGIIDDAKSAISNFFKGIKDKILSVVKTVTKGISTVIPGGVKSATSGIVKGLKSISGGVKSVVKKAAGGVIKGATTVGGGIVSAGKGVASSSVNAAKKVVSKAASGIIKQSGGMLKLMGKLTAKGAAKVPIIGPAIESVLAGMDIKAMKKSGMSESELQQKAGKRVITGVSGMVGAAGGALLAGALGSIIPGAGTAIGAIVGAIGGDLAGRFLGGLITDYVIPKKYTKTIGAFVTGTTPPKDEMQDFIIKDGKVHKFNKRDEVMGMKTGGAINQFLHSNGKSEVMNVLLKTNWKSMMYLQAIAQNTAMMVNSLKGQSSGGSPIIVNQTLPQTSSKQMMNIPNNRDGYLSSPYAIG